MLSESLQQRLLLIFTSSTCSSLYMHHRSSWLIDHIHQWTVFSTAQVSFERATRWDVNNPEDFRMVEVTQGLSWWGLLHLEAFWGFCYYLFCRYLYMWSVAGTHPVVSLLALFSNTCPKTLSWPIPRKSPINSSSISWLRAQSLLLTFLVCFCLWICIHP